jgi:hypothetical protein
MKIKKGVSVFGVRPEMLFAVGVAESVYLEEVGQGVTITSVTDGNHRSIVHGVGCGVDIRTRFDGRAEQWSDTTKHRIAKKIIDRLNGEFDVVIEKTHIHIELDRR